MRLNMKAATKALMHGSFSSMHQTHKRAHILCAFPSFFVKSGRLTEQSFYMDTAFPLSVAGIFSPLSRFLMNYREDSLRI